MRSPVSITCCLLWLLSAWTAWAVSATPLLKEQFHVTGSVNVTVPLPNGQILIGGDFETVNGVAQARLARLNADGSLDRSWSPQPRDTIDYIAVDGDEVYFAVRAGYPGQVRRAKLSSDGQVDPDWGISYNKGPTGELLEGIAVSGGFVYLLKLGYNRTVTRETHTLSRYFRSGKGALDRVWTPKAIVSVSTASPVSFARLLADDQDVYVGYATASRTTFLSPVTVLNRFPVAGRGTRDARWRTIVKHPLGRIEGLAQDGQFLYLAGEDLKAGRATASGAARLSKTTHTFDPSWPAAAVAGRRWADVSVLAGSAFLVDSDALAGLATGPENSAGSARFSVLLPADSATQVAAGLDAAYLRPAAGSTSPMRIFRAEGSTGTIDNSFHPRIFQEAQINQVLRLANGTIFVAGRFDAVGEVSVANLARFEPDGELNQSWIPRLYAVNKIEVFAGAVYAYDEYGTLLRIPLASPAKVDEGFSPNAKLQAAVPPGDEVFLVDAVFFGGSAYVNYQRRTLPERLDKLFKIPLSGDGARDLAWNTTTGRVLLEADQGFVYTRNGTSVDRYAVDGAGVRDASWRIPDSAARALAFDNTFIYTVEDTAGVKRFALAAPGARDNTWQADLRLQPGYDDFRGNLLQLGAWLYVTGNFDAVNGEPHMGVARLGAGGAPDANFNSSVPYVPGSLGQRWVGAVAENPILGGLYREVDGAAGAPPQVFNSLTPPVLTRSGTRIFAALPEGTSAEIQFLRIVALQGGTLATSGGAALTAGDFVERSEGEAGFDFTPDPNFTGTRSLQVASALSATDAETGSSATLIDLTGTVPPKNRYTMAAAALTVREGSPAVVIAVQKIGPAAGGVTLALEEGVARLGTHFTAPASLTLDFPAGDGVASLSVPLLDDLVFTGNRDFRVLLAATTDGGIIQAPAATAVTIVDDDPLGDTSSLITRPALVAPPAGNATLQVTLNAPLGAWRLFGEAIWHANGETLAGLTRGNYFVEFRLANGFIAPPARTVPVDFGEQVVVAANYLPLAGSAIGALAVSIEPASVAGAQGVDRGQWKIAGETVWHDSGETVENLPAGPYDILFKPVAGRQTPPPQTVNVAGAILYSVTGTYLIANAAAGAEPQPVDFATVQTEPYGFVGQIRTPVGFASGTAVRSRVVLTVAHALFDDLTLSAVTDARWYYQKARGDLEPAPQGARGWYIFEGYASQRATDLASGAGGVGISTPESQQLDVAAMWFLEPCARGSFSGYLRTDANNDWLLTARRRILAGYPIDEVAEEQRGILYATDPAVASTFTAPNPVIRATDSLSGSGGISGGPLFVEENGAFYPAGVFLGGTAQCLVRVIDQAVVDLIIRGEASGNGGDNNVGGGITLVSPGITGSPFAPTILGCNLGPAGALAQGAAWRIAGERSYRASGTRILTSPGTYRLEFKPVAGFAPPPSQVVKLVLGQAATARVTYLLGVTITTSVTPAGTGTAAGGEFPLGELGTITARPDANHLFSAWTENGVVISRKAVLSFNASGPRQFTAVFVEGSFFNYQGTYSGFHEKAGVVDGLANFTITGTGKFSGKVTYLGKTYAASGTLDEDGSFTGPLGSFPLRLSLDRTSPVGVLTGEIFDGGDGTTFTATLSPYSALHTTTLAGAYTLLLPSADQTDGTRPPGTGAVSVKITTAGAVTFIGTLADGVAISGSGSLIDGDVWPLYAPTFHGTGGLAGSMQFRKVDGVSDADGNLQWRRPPAQTDKLYPGGFSTTLAALGSAYTAPAVNFSSATLQLQGVGLAPGLTRPLSVSTRFVLTSTADRTVRLTIDAKTGRFSGTMTHPDTKKPLRLGGAVFQASKTVRGFIVGAPPTTGALEIVPLP